MSDIEIDVDGDIVFTNLALSMVEDEDAIAQEIQIAMRFFQGEWKLDTRVGIPYFQKIFTGEKTDNLDLITTIYRRALLSIPGVLTVSKCVVTYDEDGTLRKILVDWECTVDGGAVIEGVDALVIP